MKRIKEKKGRELEDIGDTERKSRRGKYEGGREGKKKTGTTRHKKDKIQ